MWNESRNLISGYVTLSCKKIKELFQINFVVVVQLFIFLTISGTIQPSIALATINTLLSREFAPKQDQKAMESLSRKNQFRNKFNLCGKKFRKSKQTSR